jgi:hypothetical protein
VNGILIVTSALVLAQAAPKEETPKEKPAAQVAAQVEQALVDKVKKLVVQLDDDSQARRDAAEKALIEIGPDLLDILPPPGSKASIELKARLARVRTAVEKTYIESFTKPSVVTMKGTLKLAEAIASLAKQSGNTIIDARERFNQAPDNRDVMLDVDKVTFFEALDKLLDAAGMTVYGYSDKPGELLLMNSNEGDETRVSRSSYAGLFRLEAKRLEATRELRNPAGSGLRITTDIAWEPRLRPIVLELPLTDLKAVDENGAEIKTVGEGEQQYGIETTNSTLEIDLQLGLPPRGATKVASVKGTFTALVPGRVEKFEFSGLDKAKNVAVQRGTCLVTFEQLRKNDDVHEVRLRLKFDEAANALESHRGWIGNNPAYIIDAKGTKIDSGGFSPSLVAENEAVLSYIFDLSEIDIAKCRFIYETPAALFKVPVEFELKDLELP